MKYHAKNTPKHVISCAINLGGVTIIIHYTKNATVEVMRVHSAVFNERSLGPLLREPRSRSAARAIAESYVLLSSCKHVVMTTTAIGPVNTHIKHYHITTILHNTYTIPPSPSMLLIAAHMYDGMMNSIKGKPHSTFLNTTESTPVRAIIEVCSTCRRHRYIAYFCFIETKRIYQIDNVDAFLNHS